MQGALATPLVGSLTQIAGFGEPEPGFVVRKSRKSGAAAVGRIQRARGEKPWVTYAKTLDPVASIHAAAELLAWSLEVCGSLAEAITVYNRGGRCGKPNAFSRGVLRLAAELRALTGEEPTS